MTIQQRIRRHAQSPRLGVLFFCAALSATIAWVQLSGGSATVPRNGIEFQARFSHPKIIQGGDGTVYLNVSVMTPDLIPARSDRQKTDLVLVLDRSGSMGEANKWQFATQAVQSLLNRLNPTDRVGLVTFDTRGRIETPLVPAGAEALDRVRRLVDDLQPGDNTNLGEGLQMARGMFRFAPRSESRRRVILLSDGLANEGIVDPEELNQIARRMADDGAVVSTIGMGLGFNEVLMASLADHGMGRFSFLESLESLGTILAAELTQSRQIFADGSELRLELPAGIRLQDAAGYPFEMEGQVAEIRTGQLLSGRRKEFMLTLEVDNQHLTSYRLRDVELGYFREGTRFVQQLQSDPLQVACIAQERKHEVVESVDKEVVREAWLRNNLGSLMKSVSNLVRSGDEKKAKEVLGDYRSRIEAAEEAAAVPGLADEVGGRLAELEARVDDAFHGHNQKVKQNRAAKELYGSSQQLQRVQKKNPKGGSKP